MDVLTWLFYVMVFLWVGGFSYWVMQMGWVNPVQKRLPLFMAAPEADRLGTPAPMDFMTPWLSRLRPLVFLARSADDVDTSPMRQKFMTAGIRSASALDVYDLSKVGLTACFAVIAWFVLWSVSSDGSALARMSWTLAAAACGYYVPDMVLRFLIRRRQRRLFNAFPNALDLMRVCVQAGLGLDAALDRVGREMRLSSPDISEEFSLTGLALRAGLSRADALRQMAWRIGLPDIEALVSMLIQADRFGTSVADSLNIHADNLRIKRRQRAEETAAKLPVKLVLPLIFCIFPALLTVLLGPAAISIYRNFLISTVGT
jgi:tight adherence protein C